MSTQINEKKLKSLIKESVKEVMESELRELRALAVPGVSREEQKDIEKRYGKPSRQVSNESNIEA